MSAVESSQRQMALALDRLAWGCADLHRQLIERGLWPAPSVVLSTPDGRRVAVLGTRLRSAPGASRAQGLLVPRDACLWGDLQLPAMDHKQVRPAVEQALWHLSPLPPEQMLCAWSATPERDGGWRVRWGVGRRDAHPALTPRTPVYLECDEGRSALPVLNSGVQAGRSRKHLGAGASFLLVLAVLAALLSPLLLPLALERQSVTRALAYVTESEPAATPLRQQLQELNQQADLAEGLGRAAQAQLPLASVVELLSATVPDGAWLERIEANGQALRIVGVADNAGEVLALLTRQPRLADVHASAPSVRDATLGKERFTAEMRWRGASAAAPAAEAQP